MSESKPTDEGQESLTHQLSSPSPRRFTNNSNRPLPSPPRTPPPSVTIPVSSPPRGSVLQHPSNQSTTNAGIQKWPATSFSSNEREEHSSQGNTTPNGSTSLSSRETEPASNDNTSSTTCNEKSLGNQTKSTSFSRSTGNIQRLKDLQKNLISLPIELVTPTRTFVKVGGTTRIVVHNLNFFTQCISRTGRTIGKVEG